MQLHTSVESDEYSELPTTPEHDQTLLNKCYEFPASPQAIISFQHISQRKCPTPYPEDNPEKEDKIHQEQVYEVSQGRFICFTTY